MDSILHPEHKITRSDAAMLNALTDTRTTAGRQWMAQLTETHRWAIVTKIVASIQELQRGDRQDMKILARLSLVLARFDDIDLRREQGTQPREGDKHVHFHGPDLSKMTTDELKARLALIKEARGADTDA